MFRPPPPPWLCAVLLLMMEFVKVTSDMPQRNTPPARVEAVLSEIVVPVTVSNPMLPAATPPASNALLPETLELASVTLALDSSRNPPPSPLGARLSNTVVRVSCAALVPSMLIPPPPEAPATTRFPCTTTLSMVSDASNTRTPPPAPFSTVLKLTRPPVMLTVEPAEMLTPPPD